MYIYICTRRGPSLAASVLVISCMLGLADSEDLDLLVFSSPSVTLFLPPLQHCFLISERGNLMETYHLVLCTLRNLSLHNVWLWSHHVFFFSSNLDFKNNL